MTVRFKIANTADTCKEYCTELMASHELESKFVPMLQKIHPNEDQWSRGQKTDAQIMIMGALDEFYTARFGFVREVSATGEL